MKILNITNYYFIFKLTRFFVIRFLPPEKNQKDKHVDFSFHGLLLLFSLMYEPSPLALVQMWTVTTVMMRAANPTDTMMTHHTAGKREVPSVKYSQRFLAVKCISSLQSLPGPSGCLLSVSLLLFSDVHS